MDMQQLALKQAALKALADEVAARQKEVKAQMQEALDTTGASRVEAKLPDGTKVGTISRPDTKKEARITDPDLFLKWVQKHSPHNAVTRLVTEVRPAYSTALLAEMAAAGTAEVVDKETGVVEEVPGVEIKPTQNTTHSVRLAKGGKEAIAEAWNAGALAHLALPQLTVGGTA